MAFQRRRFKRYGHFQFLPRARLAKKSGIWQVYWQDLINTNKYEKNVKILVTIFALCAKVPNIQDELSVIVIYILSCFTPAQPRVDKINILFWLGSAVSL